MGQNLYISFLLAPSTLFSLSYRSFHFILLIYLSSIFLNIFGIFIPFEYVLGKNAIMDWLGTTIGVIDSGFRLVWVLKDLIEEYIQASRDHAGL